MISRQSYHEINISRQFTHCRWVNECLSPVTPLNGCLNDVSVLGMFLEERSQQ
jgi:hypothetical protein